MNLKSLRASFAIPVSLSVVLTLFLFSNSFKSPNPAPKETSLERNLQIQYSMRTFAIDRWNKKFVGARTAVVNLGPFKNSFGESVGIEISTTDFNPSTEANLMGNAWKNHVGLLFGKLETKKERDFLCQLFFAGLMYEGDTFGKYFSNHRIELNNLGLVPYSFDEIVMKNDFRTTILFPTGERPETLFRCQASGIYIKTGGGYSAPYPTVIAWQYSRRTGVVKAEFNLSLLTS